MDQIAYPKLDFYTGSFLDSSIETEYRASTHAQALQLACWITSACAMIWLASAINEWQLLDRQPAMIHLISARIVMAVLTLGVVVTWLRRLKRPPSRLDGALLTGWMVAYFLQFTLVTFAYLGLETTADGLAVRFVTMAFWITLTMGMVGMFNFNFIRHAFGFILACFILYLVLLAVFRPTDLRPYLIGLTSMVLALAFLPLAIRLLAGIGRRNFYLNRVVQAEREKAEGVNSILSLLLTSTGHDTRQPLFALDANIAAMDMALDRGDVDQARDIAGRQKDIARNVSHILTSVLELARAERDLPGWRGGEVVDVPSILEQSRDAVSSLAESRGIRLHTTPVEGRVRSSSVLLERILVNLLMNAISHSGARDIQLLARRRGRLICLYVVDNGTGLSAKPVTLTSRDFFDQRLSGPARNDLSGFGMDLVFRMAEWIKAPVCIRSRPGRGVIARIALETLPEIHGNTPKIR
ncbi:sensor histidine kinase [Maricaulis parjimensis]|uniref:sensor histidine kinase n=1 Tax=Maricaulis parjimensis TaxID=144023 RepID=UPI00193A5876|nr:HAMP domain-containing sensor histidine kinase [Maricaulis parjimensis]